MDEAELWRRARHDDGTAFAQIFDLHRRRIFARALAQSRGGKLLGHLISLVTVRGVEIRLIAGQVSTKFDGWAMSLADLAGSSDAALANPARWMREAGELAAGHMQQTATVRG